MMNKQTSLSALSAKERSFKSLRSPIALRVYHTRNTFDAYHIWTIIAIVIFIIGTVNSLAFIVIEYGLFNGNTVFSKGNPAIACFSELEAANFDIEDTKNYNNWFEDSSVMELAQTGIFRGPAEIQEYVELIYSPLFQMFKRSSPMVATPIRLTEEQCVINFVTGHRLQTDPVFGNPTCIDRAIGFTIYFSVTPKFTVERINLYYSNQFLSSLFGTVLDTEEVTNHVCDIMESNCQDTFQFNNLTSDSCRQMYSDLPTTNNLGKLDDKSNGCRIMHSEFAAINDAHCPHLSFIPQEDSNGHIKCQSSNNVTPEDLFSEYELDEMHKKAVLMGYPADSLFWECDYDSSNSFKGEDEGTKFDLAITESTPLSSITFQGFLCYLTIIMWITMVLTGLGAEYFFATMFLKGKWDQNTENKWKIAQFLFPLLGTTVVGLSNSHNYLALPFLVITMWKFGFPETILCLHSAVFVNELGSLQRVMEFIDGVGLVLHHQACALYVAAVVSNLIPSNRTVIGVTIPLLVQHWFALLRYYNKWLYIILEVLIEAWFQWYAFASIEILHKLHWTGGIFLGSMLFAHWMYLFSGTLDLIITHGNLRKVSHSLDLLKSSKPDAEVI